MKCSELRLRPCNCSDSWKWTGGSLRLPLQPGTEENEIMKSSEKKESMIRIAVVDSDPLRFVGFQALLSSESDFDLQWVSLAEIGAHQNVDIVLLGSHPGRNATEVLGLIRAVRPGLIVIMTACNLDDAGILKAIAAGAKGCVDEAASVKEWVRAIRIVRSGSVWAPRRVLAAFIERAYTSPSRSISSNRAPFTIRETEVLRMLVAGRSNREIAGPLGIEVRTVKAHVAKLMRKVGVPNRILLSVYAVNHSLAPSLKA